MGWIWLFLIVLAVLLVLYARERKHVQEYRAEGFERLSLQSAQKCRKLLIAGAVVIGLMVSIGIIQDAVTKRYIRNLPEWAADYMHGQGYAVVGAKGGDPRRSHDVLFCPVTIILPDDTPPETLYEAIVLLDKSSMYQRDAYDRCGIIVEEYIRTEHGPTCQLFRDRLVTAGRHDTVYDPAAAAEEKMRTEVRYKVPYVGLPEKFISDTVLGRAYLSESEARCFMDTSWKKITKGSRPDLFIDFHYYDSRGKIVFSVTTYKGEVYRVRDYRSEPLDNTLVDKRYYYDSGNGVSLDPNAKKTYIERDRKPVSHWGVGSSEDPYGAGDYMDPEDFYDDHYYDFDSFDDAELYWEEFG